MDGLGVCIYRLPRARPTGNDGGSGVIHVFAGHPATTNIRTHLINWKSVFRGGGILQ